MIEIKKKLSEKLEEYINIILSEYQNCIPKERQEFLCSITDFSECIEIIDTGTISLYYHNDKIYFPTLAFLVIEELKKNPNYGCIPEHKCYDESSLIINNNTFINYINHVIMAGLTPEEYFQESLLHETMHFCGSGGANPLKEGLTELKTRELAKKRGLKTTACGYPKEIEIVLRLQEIFGNEIMNKLTFTNRNSQISKLLIDECGEAAEYLYFTVLEKMNPPFSKYITTKFNGPNAPMKKTEIYSQIDYTEAHRIIDEYQNKIEMNSMIKKVESDEVQKGKPHGITN